jgi:hypothetical protein
MPRSTLASSSATVGWLRADASEKHEVVLGVILTHSNLCNLLLVKM